MREADEWLWRVGLAGLGRPAPGAAVRRAAAARRDRACARDRARGAAARRAAHLARSRDGGRHPRDAAASSSPPPHTTAVVVTHDAVDAVALAHRLVDRRGRPGHAGGRRARGARARPATRFAATVGGLNRVVGTRRGGVWRGGRARGAHRGVGCGIPPRARRRRRRRRGVPPGGRAARAPRSRRGRRRAPAPGASPGEWSRASCGSSRRPPACACTPPTPSVAVDLTADAVAAPRALGARALRRRGCACDPRRTVPAAAGARRLGG